MIVVDVVCEEIAAVCMLEDCVGNNSETVPRDCEVWFGVITIGTTVETLLELINWEEIVVAASGIVVVGDWERVATADEGKTKIWSEVKLLVISTVVFTAVFVVDIIVVVAASEIIVVGEWKRVATADEGNTKIWSEVKLLVISTVVFTAVFVVDILVVVAVCEKVAVAVATDCEVWIAVINEGNTVGALLELLVWEIRVVLIPSNVEVVSRFTVVRDRDCVATADEGKTKICSEVKLLTKRIVACTLFFVDDVKSVDVVVVGVSEEKAVVCNLADCVGNTSEIVLTDCEVWVSVVNVGNTVGTLLKLLNWKERVVLVSSRIEVVTWPTVAKDIGCVATADDGKTIILLEVKLLTVRKVVFTAVFVVIVVVVPIIIVCEEVAVVCTLADCVVWMSVVNVWNLVESLLELLNWEEGVVLVLSNDEVVSWFVVVRYKDCGSPVDEEKTKI